MPRDPEPSAEANPASSPMETLLEGVALAAQIWWGPEPELLQDLARGRLAADLERLSPGLDGPGREAVRELTSWIRAGEQEETARTLEAEYPRLFINARGGLKAPLYHSHYETPDGGLMGRPYLMMTERLRAAGADLRERTGEPADHLAVECEYLFFLLEAGLSSGREDLLAAGREFAGQEMLPWVRELAGRLREERTVSPFYPRAAALLVSLLEALTRPETS